jgi:hypothetical protein
MRIGMVGLVALVLGGCDKLKGDAPSATATAAAAPASTGCASDKDCKGDRICSNGNCVDPAKPSGPGAPTAAGPGAAPAGGSTGIAECDQYLDKLVRCNGSSVEDVNKMRDGYNKAIQVGMRDDIVEGCKKGLEGVNKACAAKGVTDAPAAAGDSTGIPECDEYLDKLVRCGGNPADATAKIRATFKMGIQAAGKGEYIDMCKKGLDGLNKVCAIKGIR